MATKYNPSTNIVRDSERDLNYIPTPNAIRVSEQISSDFKQGLRSFSIIGSYGTGKSSFLWAIEQTLKFRKTYFGLNMVKNPKVDFIKIVGEYQSLKESFSDVLNIKVDKNITENIFSEIFNHYHDLGKKDPLLFIVIDEFGKFLEYASYNQPERELYFIQQLAEFVNNPEYNIVMLTTVHQNFDAYAMHLQPSQRQEWTKVKGRFKEITFNEPVEQLLYLAVEHLEEKIADQENEKNAYKLVELLSKSKAFNLNNDYVQKIAKKLYPLDVFSACILTLSLQKYGQNERSLFSFLESTDHTGLFQHGIHNKGFYTIAEVYDYLSYNFFSFLNSRYNPDFSAWKAIKSSLEKIETSFDKNLSEYEKIVKTIGLLSINAKSGSIINRDFLERYAANSLEIKDAGILIENLEKKRVILYRNYNNRYILTEGTDLDIQEALFRAADKINNITDVVTLLKKNYPLTPIIAKRAMFETGTPRLFEYVISSEPITRTPESDVDGFINLVFNEKNILPEIKITSLECKEAILYCFYRNSKEIKELLFEIEKTQKVIEENPDDKVAVSELKNIVVHQRNLLNHKIINSLYRPNTPVIWIFKGEEKRLSTQKDFNSFLSGICQEIYSKTPYFNNELVNKHKISASIHTAKKNYFRALANDWDIPELGFPKEKFPPEKTIYLSLLENNGIRLCNEDPTLDIEPHNENGFYGLWEVSIDFLNSTKLGKRSVSEFVEILSRKPFKLKQGFIDFWVPTFLFIKRDEFALFGTISYIPFITDDILDLLSKRPFDFEVKAFALEGVKLDIFNSYRTILNQQSNKKVSNSSFIETIKPFLSFYKGLPDYSKETKRLSKETIAIRQSIANSKDPEQSFFEDFPNALGYSINKIQKDRSELQQYIIILQTAIKELRNCYDELIGRFDCFIQDKYFDEAIYFGEYKMSFQKRYKNLHRHLLIQSQKAFVMRLDSEIDDKDAWLNALAHVVVGKSLDKFKDEDELLLYDNFDEMIISLDSLTNISKTEFDEDKEVVLDIQINSFHQGRAHKIIRLPKRRGDDIVRLEKKIKQLLSKDKNIDLAVLTGILKDLL
ncbi:MAG: hypothetical protein ABI091_22835 [Ferruginibacter sp.]